MPNSVKFWDKIALKYSKSPVADEAAYQRKLQITQQYLRPDMDVLEFGCGTGSTAIAHAPYVKSIVAIDISSKMIEIAQEKAASKNIETLSFKKLDIDTLAATEQSFDVVMAHSILHLVENKSEVVGKVYTMLKENGVFVSSTTCLGDSLLMRFMKPFLSIAAYFGFLPKLDYFTTQGLLNCFTANGFATESQWRPKKGAALFIVAKKIATKEANEIETKAATS